MKLVHEEIKQDIKFEEGRISVWVIESRQLLSKFVKELIDQTEGEEGGFILLEGNELIRIKDSVNMITDYFSVPINSKKIKSKMAKLLEEIAEEELYCETSELKSHIQQYIMLLTERTNLNIEYDMDFGIASLFKLLEIRMEENYDSILERLCEYMKLVAELFENQLFVFVNLRQYIEAEDIGALHKFVEYEKINVLMIENQITERRDDEDYLILDKDFCII